jgi:hypothetical protein
MSNWSDDEDDEDFLEDEEEEFEEDEEDEENELFGIPSSNEDGLSPWDFLIGMIMGMFPRGLGKK